MKPILTLLLALVFEAFSLAAPSFCDTAPAVPSLEPQIIDEACEIFSSSSGTITLYPGWNLISMPVLPYKPITVEAFIDMVGNNWRYIEPPYDQPILHEGEAVGKNYAGEDVIICPPFREWQWSVKAVAVYKNGRFIVYPRKGCTYNMVPGEAYFVLAEKYPIHWYTKHTDVYLPEERDQKVKYYTEPYRLFLIGRPHHEAVSLKLNKGWNGISILQGQYLRHFDVSRPIEEWPIGSIELPVYLKSLKSDEQILNETINEKIRFDNDQSITIGKLSDDLVNQNIGATKIALWRAASQKWEVYDLPVIRLDRQVYDPNTNPYCADLRDSVMINQGEGVFLMCDSNGLYLPDLVRHTGNPPFPPGPGQVTYQGTIEPVIHLCGQTIPYDYVLVYFTYPELIGVNWFMDPKIRHEVPIKGATDAIEKMIADRSNPQRFGQLYTLIGYVETIYYENGAINPPPQLSVQVLMVDQIIDSDPPIVYYNTTE